MMFKRLFHPAVLIVLAFGLAAASIFFAAARISAGQSGVVSGIVENAEGPVAGATVRRQTSAYAVKTDENGAFTLGGLPEGETVIITAWSEGHYPAGVEVTAPEDGVSLFLNPHPIVDNADHEWYTSFAVPDDPIGCGHCMVANSSWESNAHALSGMNPRFFSMYNGTDTDGEIEIGPSYVGDFPGTTGNCANCHAPGLAANYPFTADMNALEGVEAEGVFCDFCHKVAGVYLDPASGMPYNNAPGVQSMALNRPPADTHMFYGPFDDVTRRVSYLELEKRSEFCAPCHQFSYWGVPIYESFAEWLASPYSEEGVECQTCHMAPTGIEYFVFPEKGGLIRPAELIASHAQPGAADPDLLRETVEMVLSAERTTDGLAVMVTITNTGAGHHVPTDYPGRHMILIVEAVGANGETLALLDGPVVPEWGGPEAGLPGMAFAKVLKDPITGEQPVVNYWKPLALASDNRIPAYESSVSRYVFELPEDSAAVTARLIFRRLFYEIASAKRWDMPDMLMEEIRLEKDVISDG
jgi:hypothetical protein